MIRVAHLEVVQAPQRKRRRHRLAEEEPRVSCLSRVGEDRSRLAPAEPAVSQEATARPRPGCERGDRGASNGTALFRRRSCKFSRFEPPPDRQAVVAVVLELDRRQVGPVSE
jgi:hypothetical protein